MVIRSAWAARNALRAPQALVLISDIPTATLTKLMALGKRITKLVKK